MKWILKQLGTIPKRPDMNVPHWIRKTMSYRRGLFTFDGPSRTLVIRASYYLGAAFVAEWAGLRWSVGKPDVAQEKMPVVTGFKRELELAPILVTENLYRRVLSGRADDKAIDVAVEYWSSFAINGEIRAS